MPVLVAGRALQGLGAGAVPSVAYVAIGRSLPDKLRARMMAILSTAWVAPGLAGPAISAEVAKLFGWRWVFLGLLPFIAITGPFAIPALVRLGRPDKPAVGGHRLIDGIGVAAAAGLVLGGLTLAAGSASAGATGTVAAGGGGAAGGAGGGVGRGLPILAGLALVIAGLVIGLPLLRRLLPAGTLTARYGLPATILSRSLLTFAFFGADAFVTLTITLLRHRSPVVAGLAVTGSTLAWTTGAWVQARMSTRWEGRRLVRIGLSIILAGIAGLALMLSSRVSITVGIVAWTIAGLGMGLCYAPITLLMLDEAPAGREGWASASLNLADVLGSALGIGIGGAAISAAVTLRWPLAAGIAVAFAITAVAGVIGLVITRRLPASSRRSNPNATNATVDLPSVSGQVG
jgi:MFS family permease